MKQSIGDVYMGVDRRQCSERRRGIERRDLVRFDSLGSERRVLNHRRKEDTFKPTVC